MSLFLLYSCGVLLAALVGGVLPLLFSFSHRHAQIAVSFVAGIMLSVALLHMLPHSIETVEEVPSAMGALLLGLLSMFFLERFYCFHHHDESHSCEHGEEGHRHGHSLSWKGAFVGLTIHSLLAGVALGASMAVESHGSLRGIETFIAIALHKPFEAFTITMLMGEGSTTRKRLLVIALFSLVVPLGMYLFSFGMSGFEGAGANLVLAFSAGMFLCISLSDLLPELQFHQHDRVSLSLALMFGVATIWLLEKTHQGHINSHHSHVESEHVN